MPEKTAIKIVTTKLTKAGCAANDITPLLHAAHVQPLARGVYACGVYIANCSPLFSRKKPGFIEAPGPRSSQMLSVYDAWASGVAEWSCWYCHTSHTTSVAVPGMMPSVGPTGYVFPLSHTAETVRCVGVASTPVKFQPNVMSSPEAILKNDVAVCWGCVMESTPAAAVSGMGLKLELEPDACEEALGVWDMDGVESGKVRSGVA